ARAVGSRASRPGTPRIWAVMNRLGLAQLEGLALDPVVAVATLDDQPVATCRGRRAVRAAALGLSELGRPGGGVVGRAGHKLDTGRGGTLAVRAQAQALDPRFCPEAPVSRDLQGQGG